MAQKNLNQKQTRKVAYARNLLLLIPNEKIKATKSYKIVRQFLNIFSKLKFSILTRRNIQKVATRLCEFVTLIFSFGITCIFLTACHPNSRLLEPNIYLTPQPRQVDCLPSSFPQLSAEELDTDWGKELQIAEVFAREFDLYRAITAYKRALILVPFQTIERRLQIEFCLIQCYYLGEKYQEVIDAFEKSGLTTVPRSFPPFEELLLMLQDSYRQVGQCEKVERVLKVIENSYPESAEKLQLAEAYIQADLPQLAEFDQNEFLLHYHRQAKSVKRAQALNTIFPGAGYYYVGQKKAALTSFVINSLFIAAAYYFFDNHNIPAGLITTSLEMGWYFGGINGAGLAAKEYNERLYENSAKDMLFKNRLFPILMFHTCF